MRNFTLLLLFISVNFAFSQVLSEDFEAGLSLPSGWTNNDIAGGGEVWTFGSGGEAVGYNPPNTIYYTDGLMAGNYALFDSDGYGGTIAEEAALESPSFNCSGLTAVQLSFNHFFTAGYGGIGYVEVYNGSSWIEVASYTGADQAESSFGLEEIDVSTELAGVSNAQVRFRWVGDYSWGWAVDNIIVEEGPSCFVPDSFSAGTVTPNSFEINWADSNVGTPTWEIEWGLQGFTQGAGTSVTGLTSTTYTFPSLTADTVYEFYIRTNCGGSEGDSEWIGPISFTSAYDCSILSIPYTENWSNENLYLSCYSAEDTNADSLSWSFNTGVNDLDGDGTDDNFINVFPQSAGIAKDDWVFTPPFYGTAGTDYTISIKYNSVDVNATANESFNLVITDTPSSSATNQTTIGSYSGITQAGTYGDTSGNDLITQAYTSTASYTPNVDGDFHVAIHANTPAADSDVFFILEIVITETLSVDEFDLSTFKHFYNKDLKVLNLESSNQPLTNVEIFSITGQNVLQKNLSSTTGSIDVSQLSNGIYLAKVNIGGNMQTIKFVKH